MLKGKINKDEMGKLVKELKLNKIYMTELCSCNTTNDYVFALYDNENNFLTNKFEESIAYMKNTDEKFLIYGYRGCRGLLSMYKSYIRKVGTSRKYFTIKVFKADNLDECIEVF